MVKGKRKKTPSRMKYEQSHPTFSFRIYEDLKDKVENVKRAEGITNTNIVEAGVGLFEVKVKKEEEIRQQAYDEGWEKGIQQAEELYAVPYQCSVCGKEIIVDTQDEKKAIKTYMREHGWGHRDCINRRR